MRGAARSLPFYEDIAEDTLPRPGPEPSFNRKVT